MADRTQIQQKLTAVEGVVDKIRPLLDTLERLSESVVQALKSAERAGESTKVAQLIRDIDLRRPFLVGRTVVQSLQQARNDLFDLRDAIDLQPDAVRLAVRPTIQDAIDTIEKALRQHIDVLKIIEQSQIESKQFGQRILKLGVGLVKDVAGLLTGGPTSFYAKTSQALSGVQGTVATIGQLVSESRTKIKAAQAEVKRVQRLLTGGTDGTR